MNKRLELICIGDEFLVGTRANSHLLTLGSLLSERGLNIGLNRVIGDSETDIARAFRLSWECSDIVIIAGGLGINQKTNVRRVIAEVLGLELVRSEALHQSLAKELDALGVGFSERFERQCYVMPGAELIENSFGTAKGILLKEGGKLLIMLPGMSSEIRPMVERFIIPRLEYEGVLKEDPEYLILECMGVTEVDIEKRLREVREEHLDLSIEYHMHEGLLDVRLHSDALPWRTLFEIGNACHECIGEDCIGIGKDMLVKTVFELMQSMGRMLSVAESCTGGLLSHTLTNVEGASKIFAGGAVCYDNEVKIETLGVPDAIIEQHGAVSADTAVAMATAAAEHFGTEYGLSTTGFAGPDGGDKKNPVGTVYIGFHSPDGAWTHKVSYPRQREAVKIRAVNAALDFARRKLLREQSEFVANIGTE